MIIVWKSDFDKALIVPEWYLSAMLICMLFMVPIFLLFLKVMKGIFATIILVGIIAIVAIITGVATKWTFNENIIYDLRAWGEMCVGMFSYYLSNYVKSKNYGNCMNIFFKILEIVGYGVPVIFGIIPISSNFQAYFMVMTVILEFCAIFITFSEKGNIIQNENVNSVFGYLGSISLPIYLFHPVIIILIDYINDDVPRWLKYIIVFPASIILSFLYRIIADFLNKKIEERKKEKEKEKEIEKEKEKENENEKEIEKENLDKERQNDNQIFEINVSNARKLGSDELNS